jgi:hypothetical protein
MAVWLQVHGESQPRHQPAVPSSHSSQPRGSTHQASDTPWACLGGHFVPPGICHWPCGPQTQILGEMRGPGCDHFFL